MNMHMEHLGVTLLELLNDKSDWIFALPFLLIEFYS